MTEWITTLQNDCTNEYGTRPYLITLATVVDLPGGVRAEARTVVVRAINDDGTLLITSDARSQKNAQLRLNPRAAGVFWLPNARKQYRIAGAIRILTAMDSDPARLRAWRTSSNSARALFYWPDPGRQRETAADFPRSISADTPIPPAFEVLLLAPTEVETLDLNPHPHLRTRWSMTSGIWNSSTINP